MGLRTKFNLILFLTFTLGLGLSALLTHRIVQENAQEEVLQNARVMMENALAIRGFTVREIRPLLAMQMKRQFLPHSVPSFVAQENFRIMQAQFPDYTYKEAALNPTNLKDRAADWEADIINEFRNHPQREEIVVRRETPLGPSLSLAKPLTIKDPGCLTCHSTPEAAPQTMIAQYGPNNGFGWQLGETIGAQIVSVPMAVPLTRAQETFTTFMMALVAVFVGVMIILNIMLHMLVIRPVMKISRMASQVSMGQEDVPEYVRRGNDEIASLSASFNRMRRSLENAIKLLDD
ncbi:MAG: DUF3365 domain-containing protein [Candidatus Competibacteraceae bacterium]|nr:DUF3365 domain-containing protein [Candidatus Competibacteraceae bacterium]